MPFKVKVLLSEGLQVSLATFWTGYFTIRLPRFVMRQYVFLRLAVHHFNVVLSEANRTHPVTGSINDYRDGSIRCAARDQHRHQEDD